MRIFLLLLSTLIFLTSFGQIISNETCYTNLDPKTRITRQTYPFNKADKILLVKYKAIAIQGQPNHFRWDTTEMIPKIDGKIDTTKFLSKSWLTKTGIESLLEIINQKKTDTIGIEDGFFEPSNAILFFDKLGNVLEYIIVCFGPYEKVITYSSRTSSPKVTLGWWCKEKGQMLINLFRNQGVEVVISDR